MQHFTDDSRYFQEDSIKCQKLSVKVAEGFLFCLLKKQLRGVSAVTKSDTGEHLPTLNRPFMIRLHVLQYLAFVSKQWWRKL